MTQEIKSFLYLDEYKMYSISSQIFGGLTEYLTDYSGTEKAEEERQGGPIASGRAMANILKSVSSTLERKYLHDYSYSLFERGLKEREKVQSVSSENIGETIPHISEVGFVEVKAKAVFSDMDVIRSTIVKFNELGGAFAYASNFTQIEETRAQIDKALESANDRNEKTRLRQQRTALGKLENVSKEKGLHIDPTLLEKLGLLLEYGFQDQFEVRMTTGGYTFSANLKREYLREHEHLLVRKYSRFPEKEFVLFGTIAQYPTTSFETANDDDQESTVMNNPESMKEAVMLLVESLYGVESKFTGKGVNEIIIDPIALYREI